MGWAKDAYEVLNSGETATVRPQGGSMRGRIESGQLVTISPCVESLKKGDVVFVRWRGGFLLHLIKRFDGDRIQIGNNLGKINGWVARSDVLGVVTHVRD